MMDLEREQLRKSYEVCRMGFGILSVALVLACFTSVMPLVRHFYPGLTSQIMAAAWYRWLDVPITWGSLLAVIMLWGRFDHPSWQRRMGLLLVMSLADLGLWFIQHGEGLGIADGNIGHEWLLGHVGEALGWAEFALMAGLSSEYLEHLGEEHSRESGRATRSMAATGAVLWLLMFCDRTDWRAGWPMVPRPFFRAIEEYLLYQASILLWAITLFQVTALVIAAANRSGWVLREMQREDESGDPFGPGSLAGRAEEKNVYRS